MLAWSRSALRRRVLISLKSDKAIRGVLYARRGPLLVIKNPEICEPGREPARMDGEVVIERCNVDFIQVLDVPPTVG